MAIDIKIEGTKELTNALVEIFSPITHTFGFLGDNVRIYRQLSLLRTINKAKNIAKNEGLTFTEPPLKFLVPFMEECSLEETEDNVLIDMWAKLFTSACSDYKSEHNLFIRILRELTPNEAKLLEFISSKKEHPLYNSRWHLEETAGDWSNSTIYIAIKHALATVKHKLPNEEASTEIFDFIKSRVEQPGSYIYYFDIGYGKPNEYPLDDVYNTARTKIHDLIESTSPSILEALGLIGHFKSTELWFEPYVFSVNSYYLTSLGASFIEACTTLPVYEMT